MGLWTLWDTKKALQIAGEDDRVALTKRFREEGLSTHMTDGQKLHHVWQWFVDAETNCFSLRRRIDKVHRQHEQDLKEVEEYIEHVWKLSNDRLSQLEEENKSLKTIVNESIIISGNVITSDAFEKRMNSINNLCDSLKLKSGFKQVLKNTKGDEENTVLTDTCNYNNCDNNNGNNNNNNSDKTTTICRQNCSSLYENFSAQVKSLQDMCQQFQVIISELEEKIKLLEKSNKTLELENDTLSYKLTESLTQCDQLEHQILKLEQQSKQHSIANHSQNINNNININKEFDSTSTETTASDGMTLDSLNAHTLTLDSSINSNIESQSHYKSLVKQLIELRDTHFALENELEKRNDEYEKLCAKYDKRKSRHRERLLRLRAYIESDNTSELQQQIQSNDSKHRMTSTEDELHRYRNSAIRVINTTAITSDANT